MPKPCSEAGCPKPARARGLCQTHYSTRWKVQDLPRKERRELLVKLKLYLTKEQALEVKQKAIGLKMPVSRMLRELVAKGLANTPAV